MADKNTTTGTVTKDDNVPVIDLTDVEETAAGGSGLGGMSGGAAAATAGTIGTGFPTDLSLEEQAMMEGSSEQSAAAKYNIPPSVQEKFPDLVDLINQTESMNTEERDYWFQILPIMTDQQIAKFRQILVNEKEQLTKLDQEYEEEIKRLNNKHLLEWKEFESKEKRAELTAQESKAEKTEKIEEAELLQRLSSL